MTFTYTTADHIYHRQHVLHWMGADVAQKQIVAKAVTNLRHLTARRRRVKPPRYVARYPCKIFSFEQNHRRAARGRAEDSGCLIAPGSLHILFPEISRLS